MCDTLEFLLNNCSISAHFLFKNSSCAWAHFCLIRFSNSQYLVSLPWFFFFLQRGHKVLLYFHLWCCCLSTFGTCFLVALFIMSAKFWYFSCDGGCDCPLCIFDFLSKLILQLLYARISIVTGLQRHHLYHFALPVHEDLPYSLLNHSQPLH